MKNDAITIDARGRILGRVATEIAVALRGKDQVDFTPHLISGVPVIVTNAAEVQVTGRKLDQKLYYRHTGYIGHLKSTKLRDVMEQRPEKVLEAAVYGMLPRNRLRKELMKRLTIHRAEPAVAEPKVSKE